MRDAPGYPETRRDRNAWVDALRGPRRDLDPASPYAVLVEREPVGEGREVDVATVFITNRECPWRCVMCDLWTHTLARRGPPGAVARQVEEAVSTLPATPWIKLYNAGSLFDEAAVPRGERAAIARAVRGYERVVVECHPALVGAAVDDFAARIDGRLEVAMGLETACEEVLAKLNKGITLRDFTRAAEYLHARGIDLRVFVLLPPPFMPLRDGVEWVARSSAFAQSVDARLAAIIPTRAGNGAMDALQRDGQFAPPDLRALEAALEQAQGVCRTTLVLADLWDLRAFSTCDACFDARRTRLEEMNRLQRPVAPVRCDACKTIGPDIAHRAENATSAHRACRA